MTTSTPPSGVFWHRLGLAAINLCAKPVVSVFAHYEDIKGGAQCRKCGGLGQ